MNSDKTMTTLIGLVVCALAVLATGAVQAEEEATPAPTPAPAEAAKPVFMSAEWTVLACDAWNRDPVLTDKLMESGWVDNDGKRGFKVMQIYRTDCPTSPRVEMRISKKDNKAWCVYGGKVETAKLDTGMDYIMHAESKRWQEMGKGEYGPMRAMMFGRLNFDGPMWEAMSNMGPFENFLLLTGKVDTDRSTCPK